MYVNIVQNIMNFQFGHVLLTKKQTNI